MPASETLRTSLRRLSPARRAATVAGGGGALALVVLTAHVFAARPGLQIAALWLLGAALLAAWVAVLAWRIPVYGRLRVGVFAGLWSVGIALSAYLVILSGDAARPLLWRRSVQGLALVLSLVVGALFLRALLRIRASSLVGRLLSLVSPVAILALIVLLSIARA